MTKNKKNFKKNWNFLRSGVILIALYGSILPGLRAEEHVQTKELAEIQAENERLKRENSELRTTLERLKTEFREESGVLRRELIETLDKSSTQAGRLKRVEKSAAGTIETLEPVYMGTREMDLEADLKTCAESIGRLSVAVLKYCDEAAAMIPTAVPNTLEAARLRLKIETLKEHAMKAALLAAPAKPPEKLEVCRIYELNGKPELVILSAGYRDGIRAGQILRTDKAVLKVVALRNFTSAAVVTEGRFQELAPGMEVRASGK